MKIETRAVIDPTGVDFRDAMIIYEKSFPENERQTLSNIKKRIETGTSVLYVSDSHGIILSMAITWDTGCHGFILLDYLAVIDTFRNQGIGSQMLQFIAHKTTIQKKSLLIESEDPKFGNNQSERLSRINFYLKNGALIVENIRYEMPSMNDSEPIKMLLIIFPNDGAKFIKAEIVRSLIRTLYFKLYEKKLSTRKLNTFVSVSNNIINLSSKYRKNVN